MPTYDAQYINTSIDRYDPQPYVTRDGKPWIPTRTLHGAQKLAKKFNAGQEPMSPLFAEEEAGDAANR